MDNHEEILDLEPVVLGTVSRKEAELEVLTGCGHWPVGSDGCLLCWYSAPVEDQT